MMVNIELKKLFFSLLLVFPLIGNAQTWEVFDAKLNLSSRIEYDKISLLSETVRLSTSQQQLKLLNNDYRPFLSIKGESVYQYLEPWIVVKGAQGYGVYHEYGDEIFAPEYDKIEVVYTRILAQKGNDFWVYDRPLKKTIEIGNYENAYLAKNGQVIAKTGNGLVLPMSSQPKRAIEEIQQINEYVLIAKEKTGYGLINRNGTYILEPIIDQIIHLEENSFYAFDGKEYLLIKAKEEKVDIPYTSYHKITLDPDGMMLEYIHGKLRRIMKNDGILLDIVGMDKVEKVGNQTYNVFFRDKTLGLYSHKGWEVSPTNQTDKIFPGSEGLYPALKNGKYGFVNASGKFVVQPKFDQVKNYSEDLAAVKLNGKWSYIDKFDRLTIQQDFDEAFDFQQNLAIVKIDNKVNLVDKSGNLLYPEGFDRISPTADGYFITEHAKLQGLIDPFGKEITQPQFDEIRPEKRNLILVRKDLQYGIIDEKGDFVLPLNYKNIIFDNSNNKILAEDTFKVDTKNKTADNSNKNNASKKTKKGA
jgi:hypothetical protein